jgi:transcriptional regulatory protein RtcR
MKTLTVIGLLGTKLDSGRTQDRWARWRPSVGLCQHEELLIGQFELLYEVRQSELAKTIADDIRLVSPETTVCLHPVQLRDPWDFEEVFAALYEFARGYNFQTDANDYLIHITTGTHVEQICLFLLAESRHLPGRLLQTAPPARNESTAGSYRIIDLDLSRYDALATRFAEERQDGLTLLKTGIATRNPTFNRLIERIERVAIASTAPMLITGPTGAGKTHLARRIYELKRRREQLAGEFVEVNCATLRGDQAMSTLFGHVKGAFTGALSSRPGLLKAADKGLLFLDEIGELGRDEQAMLLRAIEEKRFLPLGADRETESQFQLIVGTNRSLPEMVHRGEFREDLLARVNLWTFALPGLADRREDIEPNLDYELERLSVQSGHKARMSQEARQRFLEWAQSREAVWAANFRDLNAAVVRMGTLAKAGRISLEEVEEEIDRLRMHWTDSADSGTFNSRSSDAKSFPLLQQLLNSEQLAGIDLFDRLQLESILAVCRQCRSLSDAGRQLFDVSRTARTSTNDADRLRKYLTRFGISWPKIHGEAF